MSVTDPKHGNGRARRRILRSPRAYFAYGHDIVMAALSFVIAVWLRFGDATLEVVHDLLIPGTLTFALVAAGVFLFMGLYRGVWRYASLNDLLAIAKSATVTIVLFLIVMFTWTRLQTLPRSVPFINWFVLMFLLGGPRVLYRLFKDRRFEMRLEREGHPRIPVLLAGAGDGAELFVRALARDPEPRYRVVGIVSLDPGRVGRHIQGREVLGTVDDLPQVVAHLKSRGDPPQRLVLTRDDLDGGQVRRLLEASEAQGMTLARLPRLTEFKDGMADGVEVRPVAIEDLLGRPQKRLDRAAMARLIEGRRVLVTGAGGSIGSELVRQVSDLGPEALTLLDQCEFALYTIDMELGGRHPGLPRTAVLADVRDRAALDRALAAARPEIVFHAAALKHVPLVEANPTEGLMTNVIGSRNVADACIAAGAAVMVQVSTDKAVNPTNVMGASKRIAERYCQALDLEDTETRFVTVRFGNVLGSTGSVVPLFQKQLAEGGPLTVTHPEMTRYFMTIREAVELVLQASAHGVERTDEHGRIYVLDMGEPVRILDLARQMIRLSGRADVEIAITGPRPGEKLFEEVFHGAEAPVPTAHEGVLLAAPRAGSAGEVRAEIARLEAACLAGDQALALALMAGMVPEYAAAQAGGDGVRAGAPSSAA